MSIQAALAFVFDSSDENVMVSGSAQIANSCACEKAIGTWYRRGHSCTELESSPLLGLLSRSSRLPQQPLLATARDSDNLSRDGLCIRGHGQRRC